MVLEHSNATACDAMIPVGLQFMSWLLHFQLNYLANGIGKAAEHVPNIWAFTIQKEDLEEVSGSWF